MNEFAEGKWHKATASNPSGNCLEARWMTSSWSNGSGGTNCVEVRLDDDIIEVRDTKNRDGGTLRFTGSEWDAFLAGAKAGEFDLK